MKPLVRTPVSKAGSARKFKRNIATTAYANVRGVPMRGGFRF